MIKNLNDNGTTIFLTTHYIEEAERLCDRIGFIVGGKVIKVSKVQDLMIEAQQENIVEFGIDSNGLNVEKLLTGNFPDITIKSSTDHSIRISSKNQIEIMPFMKLFDNNGIKINEAKVIRPSLEEIFVKITGIEIDKLQKEKEGKQK
jgi:ABC-2 type transport system ATP-binding protein